MEELLKRLLVESLRAFFKNLRSTNGRTKSARLNDLNASKFVMFDGDDF